jgi:hypothetical protein
MNVHDLNIRILRALEVVAGDATEIGLLGRLPDGRFAIIEPLGHHHNGLVSRTIPKVVRADGESVKAALDRVLSNKIGALLVMDLTTLTYVTSIGKVAYFTALIRDSSQTGMDGSDKTMRMPGPKVGKVQHVWMVTAYEARKVLLQSHDPKWRERDLTVLGVAEVLPVTQLRFLLEGLRALHRMGFGRLRLLGDGNSRPLRPGWMRELHDEEYAELRKRTGRPELKDELYVDDPWYYLPEKFGGDVVRGPVAWAEAYATYAPQDVWAGYGRDPAYEQWLEHVLGVSGPMGPVHSEGHDYNSSACTQQTPAAPPWTLGTPHG